MALILHLLWLILAAVPIIYNFLCCSVKLFENSTTAGIGHIQTESKNLAKETVNGLEIVNF